MATVSSEPEEVVRVSELLETSYDVNLLHIQSNLFDPVQHGLKPEFRLTNFTDLKGVQPPDINGFPNVHHVHANAPVGTGNLTSASLSPIGIGLDSCLIPLRHLGLYLVQTTDFFYPLVDDPYMMGKIAAANVLSDLYAMGVTECDNVLMILASSQKFTAEERDVVMPLIIQGFRDCAVEAGTSINGGQTVINPWVTIGGTASSIVRAEEIIPPDGAQPGDVLILTKPLGTQIAVNAHQWLTTNPEKAAKVRTILTDEEVKQAYLRAMHIMARLNRNAAKLMHVHGAHAATDITGFGLMGHAENLARNQKCAVMFIIQNMPVIAKMGQVARMFPGFGFLQGRSAETSGGLLVCMPRNKAAGFIADYKRLEGHPAWIIGSVERGDRNAKIIDKVRIIDVPSHDTADKLW
ncbi:inactive selenide, water dikinase-like protein isoform X2 [Paramacrobiotus metropolitanus]|uniref:inactive selenide, water dikinase-like protein isoform X2 n=1 Tax=Paramacrobiotus metropolitanus TaxID=2943436 RepID=UPI0024459FCA|nr:inactive selenide, water dikinase-like protein isoform X2 [Paramacrobiotus metropolitanus]